MPSPRVRKSKSSRPSSTPAAFAPSPALRLTPATHALLDLALEEDLGRGDITTLACVDARARAVGDIVAKESDGLVVAGLAVAEEVFRRLDPSAVFDVRVGDGQRARAGTVVATVRGSAGAMLTAERTALNFLQRLSGIATRTAAFVEAARRAPAPTSVRIADTRKTTPGMRWLERHAVRMGGGVNHRPDLGSGILIKDNHVALAGGVAVAVTRARSHAPHPMKIEVEIDGLEQLDEALGAGADIILLDNFSDADIARAVRRIDGRALVEVSGGVTLDRVPRLAVLGADILSVGGLTHSARAVDLSLDMRPMR